MDHRMAGTGYASVIHKFACFGALGVLWGGHRRSALNSNITSFDTPVITAANIYPLQGPDKYLPLVAPMIKETGSFAHMPS